MKSVSSPIKRILKIICIVVLIIVLLIAGMIGYLSITEFKPAKIESLEISDKSSTEVKQGDDVKVMIWNIGYGALGDNADFFMDGGENVKTSSKARIKKNIDSINKEIKKFSPDIVMLQEVDKDSSRSEHIDEVKEISNSAKGYISNYAQNFKVAFIPYPVPPMGKVDSGLVTLSKCDVSSAKRISLPTSFKWPVRIANLKRCLLVSRTRVFGTDKELVVVNLHLEAYDSGAGKIAQTKALNKLLKTEADKGNYVVAGGDFNQVFSNADMSAYPTYKDKWKPGKVEVGDFDNSLNFIMDNSEPSCRSLDKAYKNSDKSKFQYYLIDGMIYSDNIDVRSIKTKNLQFKNSDHNPVISEIRLK